MVVRYVIFTVGCGGELQGPSGSFVSPNYPLHYHHATECYWTIAVARGNKVQLVFADLETEGHSSCRYDYVQVGSRGHDKGSISWNVALY